MADQGGALGIDALGSSYNVTAPAPSGYQASAVATAGDYVPPSAIVQPEAGGVGAAAAQPNAGMMAAAQQMAGQPMGGSVPHYEPSSGAYGSAAPPAPAPTANQAFGAIGSMMGDGGTPSFATMAAAGTAATMASGAMDQANKALGATPIGGLAQRARTAVAGNLRGFGEFTGCGTRDPYTVPTCGTLLPRLRHNLLHFSANYIVVTLIITLLSALTNFTFLLSAGVLAYAWSQSIKATASGEPVKIGGIDVSPGGARMLVIAGSVFMFFAFGKDIILDILSRSFFVGVLPHAFFRNSQPEAHDGYEQAPPGPSHVEL